MLRTTESHGLGLKGVRGFRVLRGSGFRFYVFTFRLFVLWELNPEP